MRLRPQAEIHLGTASYTLRCTMQAAYEFEQVRGKQLFDPDAIDGLESALQLLWSLAVADHPQLTVFELGAASIAELQDGLKAAYELLVASMPRVDEDASAPAEEAPRLTDWPTVWALARFDLRLAEEEFWNLTPLLFHELVKRLRMVREDHLYGHCITAAAVTNCHIDPDKSSPIGPDYFMPGKRGEAERERLEAERRQALREKIFGASEMLGARKVKKRG